MNMNNPGFAGVPGMPVIPNPAGAQQLPNPASLPHIPNPPPPPCV
jgi:hypothetical protein